VELVVVAKLVEKTMTRTLCLLLLGGCQLVFDVTPTDNSLECPAELVHDEDGDGVDDVCDNCPTVANEDQADDLEAVPDGVGNLCDPNPGTGDDRIAMLELFTDPNDSAQWMGPANRWMILDESLVYPSGLDTDLDPVFDVSAERVDPPFTLVYRAVIDSVPNRYSELGIVIDANELGNGVRCGLVRYSGPDDFTHIELELLNNGTDSDSQIELSSGKAYTVTVDYTATTIGCRVVPDILTDPAQIAELTFTAPPPGRLGFKSSSMGVHVEHVVIYAKRE
jgi:hypothetical protein